MAAFRFSAVEKELSAMIFDPERLLANIPDIGDVQEAAALYRSMYDEADALGRFHKATGYSQLNTLQHIACIDTNIMEALDEMHEVFCDCRKPGVFGSRGHKEFLLTWLASPEGLPYSVRGKVVV